MEAVLFCMLSQGNWAARHIAWPQSASWWCAAVFVVRGFCQTVLILNFDFGIPILILKSKRRKAGPIAETGFLLVLRV